MATTLRPLSWGKATLPRGELVVPRAAPSTPVVHASGKTFALNTTLSIGTRSADIPIAGRSTLPNHAELAFRNGRVFLTAGCTEDNDPGALTAPSHTFVDQTEIRRCVAYMVTPHTDLSFGAAPGDNVMQVSFEEQEGSNPMMEMIMRGMARSDVVKKALE